jgi:Holliday junction resolvase
MKHLNEISEQQIQKKITTKLEQEGYFVLKIIKANKNGYPDLIAVKNNITTFIEVKRPRGVLSALQKVRIQELKDKGINVKVWCDYDTDFK